MESLPAGFPPARGKTKKESFWVLVSWAGFVAWLFFSTSSLVVPQTQACCGFPDFTTTDRDPQPFALARRVIIQ